MEALRWEDYGIFGLIIGAMFALLVWVIKNHEQERREMRTMHKEEREAWEERADLRLAKLDVDMQRREDRLENVLRELTQAVRDIHNDNVFRRKDDDQY
jgi:uncharacterized membrane protein YccC